MSEEKVQTDFNSTETEQSPPPPPAPAPPPAAKPTEERPWYQARIAEYAAKLHAAREENERLKQSMQQTQAPPPADVNPPPPAAPPPAFDQSAFDRAVQAEAQRRTMVEQFNARCEDCVQRGRTEFGATEFDGRVRALRTLVDDRDPDSSARYSGLLNAAFETGADAEIIHELGGNLDKAMRLLSMPPMKMAVELARMSNELRSGEPPSRNDAGGVTNAPAPVRPVGSRGAQHIPIAPDDPDRADGLSDREWILRRAEQVAARQKQGVIIQ